MCLVMSAARVNRRIARVAWNRFNGPPSFAKTRKPSVLSPRCALTAASVRGARGTRSRCHPLRTTTTTRWPRSDDRSVTWAAHTSDTLKPLRSSKQTKAWSRGPAVAAASRKRRASASPSRGLVSRHRPGVDGDAPPDYERRTPPHRRSGTVPTPPIDVEQPTTPPDP